MLWGKDLLIRKEGGQGGKEGGQGRKEGKKECGREERRDGKGFPQPPLPCRAMVSSSLGPSIYIWITSQWLGRVSWKKGRALGNVC